MSTGLSSARQGKRHGRGGGTAAAQEGSARMDLTGCPACTPYTKLPICVRNCPAGTHLMKLVQEARAGTRCRPSRLGDPTRVGDSSPPYRLFTRNFLRSLSKHCTALQAPSRTMRALLRQAATSGQLLAAGPGIRNLLAALQTTFGFAERPGATAHRRSLTQVGRWALWSSRCLLW